MMQTNSHDLHVAMRRPAPLAVATIPALKPDGMLLLAGLLAAVSALILAKLATI